MSRPEHSLSPDDQAVMDYVSGVAQDLGKPAGSPSPDRAFVEELRRQRARLAALKMKEPEMELVWNNVRTAAWRRRSEGVKFLSALSRGWAFRGLVAASVLVVVAVGMTATRGPTFAFLPDSDDFLFEAEAKAAGPATADSAPPAPPVAASVSETTFGVHGSQGGGGGIPTGAYVTGAYAGDPDHPRNSAFNTMIRSGSISFLHREPERLQNLITEQVYRYAGLITSLNRSGQDQDTRVQMTVGVPSEKYGEFIRGIKNLDGAQVHAQSERAQEAAGEIVDLEALLAEAQDYLKRLDTLASEKKASDLSDLQRLESERRGARRDIERFQRSLDQLKGRVAMATLEISIRSKPEEERAAESGIFHEAWDDGMEAMNRLLAFLLRIALATWPLMLLFGLLLIALRRRGKAEA